MKQRAHNRSLDLERLEAKASPASLMAAINVFESDAAEVQLPPTSVEMVAMQAPASLHWTCVPTSQEVLEFVETNTIECSFDSDEQSDYEFHRIQDDDYVEAADHAIKILSASALKAALAAEQLDAA